MRIATIMGTSRMIRFRRLGCDRWEIAFGEKDLVAKLAGDIAEVVMPDKPWWWRLWNRVRPLRVSVERRSTVTR